MDIPFAYEEALEAPKKPSESRLRYMARYGGKKNRLFAKSRGKG